MDLKKNNFDLIRLILSSTVFLVHASVLSQKEELSIITKILSSEVAVNAFFVISGFLVTFSFCNAASSKDYFQKRIRRIYPAYVFVIIISALVGFFLTDLPFKNYVSLDLIKYIVANLSFLNIIQPALPGVFGNNSMPAVNGALWTIRFEVLFYTIIPVFSYLLIRFNKKFMAFAVVPAIILTVHVSALYAETIQGSPLSMLLKITPEIFLYFICGSLLFHFYNELEDRFTLLFIISVFFYIISEISGFSNGIPLCISIIVIYLACRFRYLGNWGKYGDFSYGIYIWHFPVIQTLISFKVFDKNPYYALLLASLLIFILAWISWHFIEKQFLKRTSHYIQSTVPA